MIINLIGIIGAAIILIFFLLNEWQKIKTGSISYDMGNFIGSVLLCVYAYLLSSWPFFVLNLVWALASLRDILKKR